MIYSFRHILFHSHIVAIAVTLFTRILNISTYIFMGVISQSWLPSFFTPLHIFILLSRDAAILNLQMGIPNHFQGIRTIYFSIQSKALEMVSSKHNHFQYCFCKMISVLLLLKGLFKITSNTYNLEVISSGIRTNSGCFLLFFYLKKYISELFQHTKVALTEISSDPI